MGSPHLLYAAWGFPPARTGGVHRAIATVNRFLATGWDVTVLTAEREVFETHTGADPRLEDTVDPRARVVRLPFAWPAKETDLARWPASRVLAPRLWWHLRKRLDRRDFPEAAYGPWGRVLAAAARSVHAEHPVDLSLATLNPYVDAVAATTLHDDAAIPYVLDYRDAWTLDMFGGRTVHSVDSRIGRVERDLIAGSRQTWFVNAPIRAWHADRYPESAGRMRVVPNGFDRPFTFPPALRRDALHFGYLGTITHHVPVAELLAGWREAKRSGRLRSDDVAELHGYLGYYRDGDAALLDLVSGAADVGVTYAGPVAKGEVGRVYAGFDVLLLAMGSGRYITSGKTYEYAATGLPIVGLYDPDNETSRTLEGYPLLVPVADLRPESVATALEQAAELGRGLAADDVEQARLWASRYHRPAILDPLAEELKP